MIYIYIYSDKSLKIYLDQPCTNYYYNIITRLNEINIKYNYYYPN